MKVKNLFLSLFLIVTLGFALLAQAEQKAPRGPKITNKVIALKLPRNIHSNCSYLLTKFDFSVLAVGLF